MTSKWIDEVQSILWSDYKWKEADGLPWTDVYEVLERIDNLLRRAKAGINDENLYDEIDKEIRGTE